MQQYAISPIVQRICTYRISPANDRKLLAIVYMLENNTRSIVHTSTSRYVRIADWSAYY